MYGKDPETAWNIDSALEHIEDVFSQTGKNAVGSFFSTGKWNEASQKDYCSRLDRLGEFAERRFEGHGRKFLAGTDSVTVADCKFAHMFYSTVYNDESPFTPV